MDFADCLDRAMHYRTAAIRLDIVYRHGPTRGTVRHKDLWAARRRALRRMEDMLKAAAYVAVKEMF